MINKLKNLFKKEVARPAEEPHKRFWPEDKYRAHIRLAEELKNYNPKAHVDEYHANKDIGFACPHCGCPHTVKNVNKDGSDILGRVCKKCAEPVFVYTEFIEFDAEWRHSKGPWKVVETDDEKITVESDTMLIATLHVESIKKARFDASLMALAPEILQCLVELVELVHHKAPQEELDNALVNALTAVSKAERWEKEKRYV